MVEDTHYRFWLPHQLLHQLVPVVLLQLFETLAVNKQPSALQSLLLQQQLQLPSWSLSRRSSSSSCSNSSRCLFVFQVQQVQDPLQQHFTTVSVEAAQTAAASSSRATAGARAWSRAAQCSSGFLLSVALCLQDCWHQPVHCLLQGLLGCWLGLLLVLAARGIGRPRDCRQAATATPSQLMRQPWQQSCSAASSECGDPVAVLWRGRRHPLAAATAMKGVELHSAGMAWQTQRTGAGCPA